MGNTQSGGANSVDVLTNVASMVQDAELSTALAELQSNPSALQTYLQRAQEKLYSTVTQQKDDTFQKVYGDLERASTTERAVYYYFKRNSDLNNLQEQVFNSQKNSADAIIHDRDLAKRQYEINQWSASNKMETLFVYSQLFIILCTTVILGFLWSMGILSTWVISILGFIIALIFIFTIVNRSQYTDSVRDNRFWNRRKFPVYKPIPSPNVCSTPTDQQATTTDTVSNP
jgi:hypothetical protein